MVPHTAEMNWELTLIFNAEPVGQTLLTLDVNRHEDSTENTVQIMHTVIVIYWTCRLDLTNYVFLDCRCLYRYPTN